MRLSMLALVAVAACKVAPSAGDAALSVSMCAQPLADAGYDRCVQWLACECEREVQCGERFDTSGCLTIAQAQCSFFSAPIDDERAAQCITYLATADCARRDTDARCGDFAYRPPTVFNASGIGQPCVSTGLYCGGRDAYCPAGDYGACRHCVAAHDAGEPCNNSDGVLPYFGTCLPGLFCEGDGGPVGACAPRAGGGAACSGGTACASLSCVVLDAGMGRCAPLALGDACEPGACEAGARCDQGRCVARAATGASCFGGPDPACLDPAASCIDGTCQLVPWYSRGELAQCADRFQCEDSLFCDVGCFSRRDAGTPCTESRQCQSGLHCGGFVLDCGLFGGCVGDCRPRGTLNGPCFDMCQLGLECGTDGRCHLAQPPAVVALGDECDFSKRLCPAGAVCGGTCVPIRGEGEACIYDATCASRLCAAGHCAAVCE